MRRKQACPILLRWDRNPFGASVGSTNSAKPHGIATSNLQNQPKRETIKACLAPALIQMFLVAAVIIYHPQLSTLGETHLWRFVFEVFLDLVPQVEDDVVCFRT